MSNFSSDWFRPMQDVHWVYTIYTKALNCKEIICQKRSASNINTEVSKFLTQYQKETSERCIGFITWLLQLPAWCRSVQVSLRPLSVKASFFPNFIMCRLCTDLIYLLHGVHHGRIFVVLTLNKTVYRWDQWKVSSVKAWTWALSEFKRNYCSQYNTNNKGSVAPNKTFTWSLTPQVNGNRNILTPCPQSVLQKKLYKNPHKRGQRNICRIKLTTFIGAHVAPSCNIGSDIYACYYDSNYRY